jgi:hypothetical protein
MKIDEDFFPSNDFDWSEEHWKLFIQKQIDDKMFNYKELASAILGQINPPQVATSITKLVKHHYQKGKVWKPVKEWFENQSGRCEDCETLLDLQVDHDIPKQEIGIASDRLDNLVLRCRRCNVVKRPSHKNGGKLNLTTQSALMWILLSKRPKTYNGFKTLCRKYGMTMADLRFQEAWARALWLNREGKYEIEHQVVQLNLFGSVIDKS